MKLSDNAVIIKYLTKITPVWEQIATANFLECCCTYLDSLLLQQDNKYHTTLLRIENFRFRIEKLSESALKAFYLSTVETSQQNLIFASQLAVYRVQSHYKAFLKHVCYNNTGALLKGVKVSSCSAKMATLLSRAKSLRLEVHKIKSNS